MHLLLELHIFRLSRFFFITTLFERASTRRSCFSCSYLLRLLHEPCSPRHFSILPCDLVFPTVYCMSPMLVYFIACTLNFVRFPVCVSVCRSCSLARSLARSLLHDHSACAHLLSSSISMAMQATMADRLQQCDHRDTGARNQRQKYTNKTTLKYPCLHRISGVNKSLNMNNGEMVIHCFCVFLVAGFIIYFQGHILESGSSSTLRALVYVYPR